MAPDHCPAKNNEKGFLEKLRHLTMVTSHSTHLKVGWTTTNTLPSIPELKINMINFPFACPVKFSDRRISMLPRRFINSEATQSKFFFGYGKPTRHAFDNPPSNKLVATVEETRHRLTRGKS